MAPIDDHRVAEARGKDIGVVAEHLGITWMRRGHPERTGHCPRCGGGEKPGSDRFSLNARKNSFYCRKCDVGGDPIALVRFVRQCSFAEAVDWMLGPVEAISAEERDRRLAKAKADEAKREAEAARFRNSALRAARSVWQQGLPPAGTAVEAYLAVRKIDIGALGGFPACIRFHPALRYTAGEGRDRKVIHTGPAMLAAIQGPDGRFSGVHRTWLDLDQPKGKARILHPESGEVLASKKVLGSKKGGAIWLTGNVMARVMVAGEGLETTWSAMVSGAYPDAAFWCLVDLGNMAGRQVPVPGQRMSGLPDLEDDEAFVPPSWVRRLIYVMDGDSDPRATRAKLVAGLRRAMLLRPGLQGQIAAAPNGFDLNDVLMGVN